ncbi:MAG: type III pantothenate kinase, partial [bacterium]
MELLAIDQGNTTTKFGYFRAGRLQHNWSVATDRGATAEMLGQILQEEGIVAPLALGLSTVTLELLPAWRRMAQDSGYSLTVVNGNTPAPLQNQYGTPETLGADRFMAAVAAADLVGTPVIVISLGTAIVVDAVS